MIESASVLSYCYIRRGKLELLLNKVDNIFKSTFESFMDRVEMKKIVKLCRVLIKCWILLYGMTMILLVTWPQIASMEEQ